MDLVRLRYVGADRMRVPKLGRVVEPDELVGVPRDVFERYEWAESLWQRQDDDQEAPPPDSAGDQEAPSADAPSGQQAPADPAGAKSRKAGGRDA